MNETVVALARSIAEAAHTGQTDKAGAPYIEHPAAVAALVDGHDEKAVAYLHDVLEDSDVTAPELISAGIPPNVVEAVVAMTKVAGESYEDYLRRVRLNQLARAVKLADLSHNSQIGRIPDPSRADYARIEKYRLSIDYLT